MDVRLDRERDLEIQPTGEVDIHIDVTTRIDDCCLTCAAARNYI